MGDRRMVSQRDSAGRPQVGSYKKALDITAMTQDIDHPPRPMAQRLGAILWPSFFAAGVATMVFFALVDPLELKDITFVDWEISREAGYTIGFFMFWLATAASSTFTWILLRPASRFNRRMD